MKKLTTLLAMTAFVSSAHAASLEDTWANWERRMSRAFENISPQKLPGQTLGILVPNDPRYDLLAMHAFGYETLVSGKIGTAVFLLPAAADDSLNGLSIPNLATLETSFGTFNVDTELARLLQESELGVTINNAPYASGVPKNLENHLAALKYALEGKLSRFRVLPIRVRFTDVNAQVKDIGPLLAETIKSWKPAAGDVKIVVVGDLTWASSEPKLIQIDNQWLTAIRTLDVDGVVALRDGLEAVDKEARLPDLDAIALGILTLRWMGADHAEILGYAHSGQLVLTKSKTSPLSYVTAGFASAPPFPPRIFHVNRERMVEVFGELLRSDILVMTRQTCQSILDPTAAKPPSLSHKQAAQKWPVYITLYDSEGNVGGQTGTHVAAGPLEESIRQFAFEAVRQAKPKLTKDNFQKYVVDVSIPYGFNKVEKPEELIPYLNGVIVHSSRKTSAFHPDAWRSYPNPHQLLGAICYKLGLEPWSYANRKAQVESFRVLSFNEKEPFQDLSGASKKKKKSSGDEELEEDTSGGSNTGGGGGGLFPF